MGVRDFRGMVRPFVGPERSQLTATRRIDRVTCGKESAISTLHKSQLLFYINYLSRGGADSLERTCLRRISLFNRENTGKFRKFGQSDGIFSGIRPSIQ